MKKALILSGVKWNSPWQRHHIIAKSLVDCNYQVDFVEGIVSSKLTKNKILSIIKKKYSKSIGSNPTLKNLKIIKTLPAPRIALLEFLYKKNISKNILGEYDIIITYIPRKEIIDLLNEISYKKLVYDCVRDFENWKDVDPSILESEAVLIKKSDEIWCDSFWLEEKLSQKTEKFINRIYPTIPKFLIDGIDKKNFKRKGKVKNILYFGTISEHVDISVFVYLASLGYEILFIGISDIKLPDFIINLGYISDQKELLSRISEISDLIIIPYKGNMDGVVPSKLNLCLASGKPLVISNFFDSRKISNEKLLKNSIYIYSDKSEIIEIIDRINNFNEFQKRISNVTEFLKYNAESKFKDIF